MYRSETQNFIGLRWSHESIQGWKRVQIHEECDMWCDLISKPKSVNENNAIAFFLPLRRSPQEKSQAWKFSSILRWRQLVYELRIVDKFIQFYLSFVRALIIHGRFAPFLSLSLFADRFMPSMKSTLEYWFCFFILRNNFVLYFHDLNLIKNLFFIIQQILFSIYCFHSGKKSQI